MQENQNCSSIFSTTHVSNEAMKEIFQLLAAGEIKLCNQPKVKNATLVLGNTGVGKSVFARRIAGYEATLKSIEEGLDYTIVNPSNESDSKSFITSNTVFPELIQNNNTGAAYYDFPGFLDTRGAANDLTTTYFIKKVVDNVELVKLLLLINHTSLSNQGTRDDFINLLLHATKFVKNLDKYKDGIALIATKVQYPKKSDENIISTIAEFIKKAKNDLQQKGNGSVDYTNVIKLLDIILQQDGNMYPKIGISRSPDQTGLLSEIPIVQENTVKIKGMLAKIKFIEKNGSDFGYFIPKKSLIDIVNIVNEINHNVAATVGEIGKEIQKYLSIEEDQFPGIIALYNVISSRYDELQKLKEKANNQEGIEKCVKEVINGAASMNITSTSQNTLLMKYIDYLTFLREVSGQAIDNQFKCADALQEVIEYIRGSNKWYHFLIKLHERLSDYEIQRDTLNSLCTAFGEHVTKIIQSKNNFEFKLDPHVLKKCYPNYESQFEDIGNVTVDKPKINALEKVLSWALKTNSSYSCDSDKLVIKGRYVKLEDLPNIQKEKCKASPKFIEIFAWSKIFIDADLDKTGEIDQLSIIARVWDIRGARKIILDGAPGKAHYPAKASDGTQPGDPGMNGKPGLPGGPGGNFVGSGQTFKNLPGLTVFSRGGKGGPGQSGGDGKTGGDGADAYNDVYVENRRYKSKHHDILGIQLVSCSDDIYLAGKFGQVGGDGGHGGTGGLGGNPGNIVFIYFSSSDSDYVRGHGVTGRGSRGTDGKGGEGAAGGKYGNDLRVTKAACVDNENKERTPEQKMYDNRRSPGGDRGVDGYNSENITYPEETYWYLPTLVKYRRRRRSINLPFQTQNIDHKNVQIANNIRSSHTLKPFMPSNGKDVDVTAENTHILKYQDTNKTHAITDDHTMAKNAAITINSPINFAVNLVSNFFGQWNLFGAANITNHGLVKGGIEFMFRGSMPSDIYTTAKENTNRTIKLGNFAANESLMLVDFAIRCITRQKFYDSEEKSTDSSEVKASVVNIITEFEEILSIISAEHNLPPESLEFDPVALISKLENEVNNGNYEKIGKILYQCIESDVYLENPQSRTHVLHKLYEMLLTQKNLC